MEKELVQKLFNLAVAANEEEEKLYQWLEEIKAQHDAAHDTLTSRLEALDKFTGFNNGKDDDIKDVFYTMAEIDTLNYNNFMEMLHRRKST